MNAVISGTAGRALLVDGKSLKSFDVDDPSKLVDRQRSDLLYLFGEGRDLRIIENSDIGSIAAELKFESNSALALDLTLISFDEELEADIREDALRDLDELLVDQPLREKLEGILYARPIPDDGDLLGALELFDGADLPNSFGFFDDLNRRQSLISKVSEAWNLIPTKFFADYEHRLQFQQVAVRRGLFRSHVVMLETGDSISRVRASARLVRAKAGLDSAIKQLRNYRAILQRWADSLRESSETLEIAPPFDDIENRALSSERYEPLLKVIKGLPRERRLAVELYVLKGYSSRETSDKLAELGIECSHCTVQNWVRESLSPYFPQAMGFSMAELARKKNTRAKRRGSLKAGRKKRARTEGRPTS